MGLNPRGRGHSRGERGNFHNGGRQGNGRTNQGALFTSGPAGMFVPRGLPGFGTPVARPSKFNSNRHRPGFGKFRQGNANKKFFGGQSNLQVQEVDMTKPWITAEIKMANEKKKELLEIWKETKSKEDWDKYKAQKLNLQSMNAKAKAEYSATHPYEVMLHENSTVLCHYCETCDKSFRTEDDLLLHEAEHETCYCDGCEFTAHPKIIAKHIKMQHESGLFKRIGNLYTKEDIAKWIEERKKRYPTRKVIEDKKILEEEKTKRGERIKDDDSRFNKSFSNKSRGHRKKNYEKRVPKTKNKQQTRTKNLISAVSTSLEEDEADKIRKGVPAFSGIKNTDEPELPEKTETEISDDEWASECKPENVEEPLLNSSLKLLAQFYNSDEESVDLEPQNEAAECVSGDENTAPDEVKTVTSKNLVNEDNPNDKKFPVKRKFPEKQETYNRKKNNFGNQHNVEKQNQTLLEKLLKKEIRRERNIILQCVHYVVNQNFFKS